jgi:hypothetical protein
MVLVVALILAGGVGAVLAFRRGFDAGYAACLEYRKIKAAVDASTMPVDDSIASLDGGANR